MNSEEINALQNVVEYLKEEERDAEEVSTGHIWHSVKVLNNFLDDLHIRVLFNAGGGFLLGLIVAEIIRRM